MQDFSLCYLKSTIVAYFFPVPHLGIILGDLIGNLFPVVQDVYSLSREIRREVEQALWNLDRPVENFRMDQHIVSKYSIDLLDKIVPYEQDLFLVSAEIYPPNKHQDLIIVSDIWECLQLEGDVLRVGTVEEFKFHKGNVQQFLDKKLIDFEII